MSKESALLGCVGHKATSAGTHAQIGENSLFQYGTREMVSSSAQTAAAAVSSVLHTYTRPSIASSPWMAPLPRVRSPGCIDRVELLLGLQSLLCPNRTSKADELSIRSCSRPRSVDTYLAAGLDASFCMAASWPDGWDGPGVGNLAY